MHCTFNLLELEHRLTQNIRYYFCRTDLNVTLGTIIKSFPQSSNVGKAELGTVMSFGYLFYAIGKLVNGHLMDRPNQSRRVFRNGLLGTILATTMIALLPSPIGDNSRSVLFCFGVLWSANRLAQSASWGSVVKILSEWFPPESHGQVIALATICYGFGDVAIRMFLGLVLTFLMRDGATSTDADRAWRAIFLISAFCTSLLTLPTLLHLKNTPPHHYMIQSKCDNDLDAESRSRVQGVWGLLRIPKFWILLCLAPGLTLIRETFITWTATFLVDELNLREGDAVVLSLLFPLFGTFSTLIGGYLIDHLSNLKRAMVPIAFMVLLTVTLSFFSAVTSTFVSTSGIVLWQVQVTSCFLSVVALALMAPFSFVDGIFVLSLAGKESAGIAIGIINAVGYVGAILAGHQMGSLAELHGWANVLLLLSIISFFCTLLFAFYLYLEFHTVPAAPSLKCKPIDSIN